ncbi:Methyltransferase-like protein 7A [Chionoecetes opilio]|uniref:Methyltransferase-like protein 7A n=1 Tax=Chionoecetes opilio TaxID=41210 RepID=A0A8J4YGQ6_CHIOP|nr:Methyltransferase-like protein 7A [Chionoecetes opilio]
MGDDTSAESWLSSTAFKLLVLLCVFLILKKLWPDFRRRYFAAFMSSFSDCKDAKTEEMKKDIFSTINTVTSHDPELRKQKAIKILEIGVGTGTNFAHYPDGTRLVVVDPNPHFKSYYDANRQKFPKIHSEEIILTTGEKMDMVKDNSVDVVVTTLVLCTVEDLTKVLQQILRVLAPGGRFYFFEHIAEFNTEQHGTRRKIQEILTWTGIWPLLFDGCMLNRDMLADIQKAGFSKVQAQRFYSPIDHIVFQLVKPSIKGVAEK